MKRLTHKELRAKRNIEYIGRRKRKKRGLGKEKEEKKEEKFS